MFTRGHKGRMCLPLTSFFTMEAQGVKTHRPYRRFTAKAAVKSDSKYTNEELTSHLACPPRVQSSLSHQQLGLPTKRRDFRLVKFPSRLIILIY